MGKKVSWFSSIKGVFSRPPPSSLHQNHHRWFKKLLSREPSSIEKILGEVDLHFPQPHPKLLHSPPRLATSPTTSSPTKSTHIISNTPHLHVSATKIQAAYRRYKSRRNLKGRNVKRQTVNAMKQMQLLVRVQTQIHSRRIQMLDNKPPSLSNLSEMRDWDDTLISKEETQARLKKKVLAVTNRERAMSYAYSNKKASGNGSGGYPAYPWWWNSQLPPTLKNHHFTDQKQTPKQPDTPIAPISSRSLAPSRTRQQQQQQQQQQPQTTPPNRMMLLKYPKSRARGGGYPMKDDDSLMSCPAFTVPNYMSPTVSAKAKARPTSTPGSVSSKRRFSFPFTPNWNKHKSPASVGDLSVDSAPASLGRKPFNRFV